jgi:hypothetical protein
MFEHRSAPLLPFARFLRRFLRSVALVCVLLGVSLAIGVLGYHAIAALPWIDALLDASMILAGMGPVSELRSDAAKVFAAIYALFSGVVFITSIGVIGAPVVHRFLHQFHLEAKTPRRG